VLRELINHGVERRAISLPRGRFGLHVMPINTGYEIRQNETYDWSGRHRGRAPFVVLQHTISGQGMLRYERHSQALRAGDTMLVIAPHDHRYWLPEGKSWEHFWVSMNGAEALRIHRSILATAGPVLRLTQPTIDRLAACCLRLLRGTFTAGGASAIAYEATMALHDEVFARSAPEQSVSHPMQPVIDHVLAHLEADLPVDELAAISSMSRAHFSRAFKDTVGLPPARYVLDQKLQATAKLLANTGLPIKEVALSCGFADANYFSKVFRRAYGHSPSEHRDGGGHSPEVGRT